MNSVVGGIKPLASTFVLAYNVDSTVIDLCWAWLSMNRSVFCTQSLICYLIHATRLCDECVSVHGIAAYYLF